MAKDKEPPCHSTGSVIATTIKSPSSSNLELPSFMPGCVLPPADLDEGDFTEGHELDRKSVERHCQRSAKLTI